MSKSYGMSERLEDQIVWYDGKSISNQRWHKTLSVVELLAAVGIPISAGADAPSLLLGVLGGLIVVIRGLETLNQYQHNWIVYRSTCEALKHEKYLRSARAGPYAEAAKPDALLAERVESLISNEHAKWVVGREKAKNEFRGDTARNGPTGDVDD